MSYVVLEIKVWQKRQNNGMFDYSEKQKRQYRFKIQNAGKILMDKQTYNIVYLPQNKLTKSKEDRQFTILCDISVKNSEFYINQQDPEEYLYKIVSSEEKERVEIREKDIIKIGKIEIKVLSIKKNKPTIQGTHYEKIDKNFYIGCSFSQITTTNKNNDQIDASQIQQNPFCRYCYNKTAPQDNKLVNFCICEGSTKFTHINCMIQWIKKRCTPVEDHDKSIFRCELKGLECQICKHTFRIDKIYPYLVQKPFQQYIILEVKTNKPIIVIADLAKENKQQLIIGRNSQNDIVISQLSVSRKHCKLIFNQQTKQLSLVDLSSKFGTSIQAYKKQNAQYKITNDVSYQRGRAVMRFFRKQKQALFKRFFCNRQQDLYDNKKRK